MRNRAWALLLQYKIQISVSTAKYKPLEDRKTHMWLWHPGSHCRIWCHPTELDIKFLLTVMTALGPVSTRLSFTRHRPWLACSHLHLHNNVILHTETIWFDKLYLSRGLSQLSVKSCNTLILICWMLIVSLSPLPSLPPWETGQEHYVRIQANGEKHFLPLNGHEY